MKKLSDYRFIIILVIFIIMAMFFPLVGEDLFYNLSEVKSLNGLFNLSSNGVLTDSILLILTRYKLLRVVTYGVIGVSMFLMMKSTVNRRNDVLMFIALFFFILMDKSVISSSFIYTTGFAENFIGSLFLVIFMNIIIKNHVFKMNPFILFLLGIIGTSINPVYASTLFIVTFIYMVLSFKEGYTKGFLPLLVGMVFGIAIMALNSSFVYTGYSYNLLHEFIPRVMGTNFLIVLVLSAIILILSIKVFMRENRILTGLSMASIMVFLFSSLLSTSYIVNYILYVAYLFGTFYLLKHINKSQIFKRKLYVYYGFKCLFIVLSCIFGGIYEGSVLFLYLVDIILILELYNYLLPSEFLDWVWVGAFILLGIANIYIYRNVFYEHKEMNFYIENKLECTYDEFIIPTKYKNDYLYKYIPSNEEELDLYIEYYEIDVYNEERKIELKFRE